MIKFNIANREELVIKPSSIIQIRKYFDPIYKYSSCDEYIYGALYIPAIELVVTYSSTPIILKFEEKEERDKIYNEILEQLENE